MRERLGADTVRLILSKKNLDSIRTNEAAYRDLMGTSFLVVTPTLTEVNDWKSLTDHTTSTLAIDKLRKDTPRLNGVSLRSLSSCFIPASSLPPCSASARS